MGKVETCINAIRNPWGVRILSGSNLRNIHFSDVWGERVRCAESPIERYTQCRLLHVRC